MEMDKIGDMEERATLFGGGALELLYVPCLAHYSGLISGLIAVITSITLRSPSGSGLDKSCIVLVVLPRPSRNTVYLQQRALSQSELARERLHYYPNLPYYLLLICVCACV